MKLWPICAQLIVVVMRMRPLTFSVALIPQPSSRYCSKGRELQLTTWSF